jgi:hypothetical protein
MEEELSELSSELARMIEAGIERQLNQSIKYSPLRLFLKLFKKGNPRLIQSIRNTLTDDIQETLINIEGWDQGVFTKKGYLSDEGNLLVKKCYNIGIRLVRKLNVRSAFRIVKDRNLQKEIYDHILEKVGEKAAEILKDK